VTLQPAATDISPSPEPHLDLVGEEAVAVVCNGSTLAVMMATPADLEDFAVGFAVTEGVVQDLSELSELEIVRHAIGVEARLWLTPDAAARVATRQRSMAGPVGCGLCGIDSLSKVERPLRRLADGGPRLSAKEARAAPALLRAHQPNHDRTRASHAAGFLVPGQGIVLAREDVGRHNALDKLAGALVHAGLHPALGAVVLTSRVSTEMVQKTVALGVPILVAVSAATDNVVRLAAEANLTLVARVSGGCGEILSAPHRIEAQALGETWQVNQARPEPG
jgi:FdhD protein